MMIRAHYVIVCRACHRHCDRTHKLQPGIERAIVNPTCLSGGIKIIVYFQPGDR